MNRMKELAKFASGFEAFHALANAYFWMSGMSLMLFGVATTPQMHLASALVNAAFAGGLGAYAWRSSRQGSAS